MNFLISLFSLTRKSLAHRRLTSFLCVLSIALSTALILGVEKSRHGAREGFASTVSGADLLIGARSGELQLLLYSLFHMGEAVNNIRYQSYQQIASMRQVAWTIPFSLGDSYRGHRVVGTDHNFFEHYRFGQRQELSFQSGREFQGIFEVVLGHQVARVHQHQIGDRIFLSHGLSREATQKHDNISFEVVGILSPTGTPLDHGLYVSLYGLEAIHIGWETGAPNQERLATAQEVRKEDLEITQITSFLVGAQNRMMTLQLRRAIADFREEPLLAIIPALTLGRLWQTLSQIENILFFISLCVLAVGLMSILIALYTTLNERRKEMAILRSIGASGPFILSLLLFESLLLVFIGVISGVVLLFLAMSWLIPFLEYHYAMRLQVEWVTTEDLRFALILLGLSLLIGLIPGLKAYFQSLRDGLSP